jgi:hypothetical protein
MLPVVICRQCFLDGPSSCFLAFSLLQFKVKEVRLLVGEPNTAVCSLYVAAAKAYSVGTNQKDEALIHAHTVMYRVSKFPTDINLQDSGMVNRNSREFSGIPEIIGHSVFIYYLAMVWVLLMLECVFVVVKTCFPAVA